MTSVWLALLFASGLGGTAPPSDVPLPPELHYLLLAKALSFDRAFARFGDEVVLAVVYQEEYPASRAVANAFTRAAAASPAKAVNGVPVRVVRVRLAETAQLAEQLRAAGADVAYVAPLRAVRVGAVVSAAHQAGAATCTGVPAYVAEGVALAVSRKGERSHLVVAIEQAHSEGSEYGSQLLGWAEVVR